MLSPAQPPALAAWLSDGRLTHCIACGKPATASAWIECGPEHDFLIPGQIRDALYKWLRERRALVLPRAGVEAPTCAWHSRGYHVWPTLVWLAVYDALLVMRLQLVPELRAEIVTGKAAGLLGPGR